MITNARAKRYYRKFNKKFFGNKLSNGIEIRFVPMKDYHGTTEYERVIHPSCQRTSKKAIRILLDWDLRKSGVHTVMTLVHEMVHVRYPNAHHGPVFQKEMLRVAKAGIFKGYW